MTSPIFGNYTPEGLPQPFYDINRLWRYLHLFFDSNIEELARLRGYIPDYDSEFPEFQEQQEVDPSAHPFLYNTPDILYFDFTGKDKLREMFYQSPEYLGLLDSNGSILLENRWVVPICLPDGTVVALVGWAPGKGAKMKYLTTPTKGFSKRPILFGAHTLHKYDTPYTLVVEGIFDQLALNAVGIRAVSVMGRICTDYHLAQLSRLPGKIVGVPDKDAPDVINYDKWKIGNYLSWTSQIPAKDFDDFVSLFGESTQETLMGLEVSHQYHTKLRIG